ncbi:MAG: phospholipase D-like domain-containing protein [Candidatus Andersenbacteria bacterium]
MLTGIYHVTKPLPEGVSVAWPVRQTAPVNIIFLADRTFVTTNDDEMIQRQSTQHIFDEMFLMIESAEHFIVTDMFLYNDWQGSVPEEHRQLAISFTQALLIKKAANPAMPIVVITDPINEAYGGDSSLYFERLRQAGIEVKVTDLKPLRDSNPLFSAPWRTFVQWFGNANTGGILSHPFAANGPNVTARTWLTLLNFKANHRKVLIADETVLVTSANPHDGSSAHSNIAIKVTDRQLAQDAIASERAIASFPVLRELPADNQPPKDQSARVQLLTEGAIRQTLLELINRAEAQDTIDMFVFYLSDRAIVNALLQAAQRGADVRLILDPNKDAFGHTKNGVPNRPVAFELITKSEGKIRVRWCDTHGEQCHSKLVLLHIGDRYVMTAGSANLTRRNIGDYNLETNILVSADEEIPAIADAHSHFGEIWNNEGGRTFTTDYVQYADSSLFKTILYRIQEATGLSSF